MAADHLADARRERLTSAMAAKLETTEARGEIAAALAVLERHLLPGATVFCKVVEPQVLVGTPAHGSDWITVTRSSVAIINETTRNTA